MSQRGLTKILHMSKKDHLPVLSAQFITAPTGKPNDILNFAPAEPPRPKITQIRVSLARTKYKPYNVKTNYNIINQYIYNLLKYSITRFNYLL